MLEMNGLYFFNVKFVQITVVFNSFHDIGTPVVVVHLLHANVTNGEISVAYTCSSRNSTNHGGGSGGSLNVSHFLDVHIVYSAELIDHACEKGT